MIQLPVSFNHFYHFWHFMCFYATWFKLIGTYINYIYIQSSLKPNSDKLSFDEYRVQQWLKFWESDHSRKTFIFNCSIRIKISTRYQWDFAHKHTPIWSTHNKEISTSKKWIFLIDLHYLVILVVVSHKVDSWLFEDDDSDHVFCLFFSKVLLSKNEGLCCLWHL